MIMFVVFVLVVCISLASPAVILKEFHGKFAGAAVTALLHKNMSESFDLGTYFKGYQGFVLFL